MRGVRLTWPAAWGSILQAQAAAAAAPAAARGKATLAYEDIYVPASGATAQSGPGSAAQVPGGSCPRALCQGAQGARPPPPPPPPCPLPRRRVSP
jgi:hypothetical protein